MSVYHHRPHPFAGGYSEGTAAQLANIKLPDKIKCKICRKRRMQSSYSKRQLEEVRYGILQGYDPDEPGIAKCRDCVGGQTVELTCCICDKTKGLDHFSKNQRRDANEARCFNCVQGHLDLEPPEGALLDKDRKNASNMSTITGQSQYGYVATADSLQKLSLNDGNVGGLGSDGLTPAGPRSASHVITDRNRPAISGSASAAKAAIPDSDSESSESSDDEAGGLWLDQQSQEQQEKLRTERKEKKKREKREMREKRERQRQLQLLHQQMNSIASNQARHMTPSMTSGTRTGPAWGKWNDVGAEDAGYNPDGSQVARIPAPSSTISQLPKRSTNFAKIKGGKVPKEGAPTMRKPEPIGQIIDSDDDDEEFNPEDWI